MNEKLTSWENLILHHSEKPKFKSRTCRIFNNESHSYDEPDKLCPCDRMIRRHSFTGDCLESKAVSSDGSNTWQPPSEFLNNKTHSSQTSVDVYGILQPSGCKFLRIDNRLPIEDLFQLIFEDCGRQKPALILSVYGGAKYFTMTERLEKEFIRGVIDAATMADAWILTAGINNGVSKLVGEGISSHRLLQEYSNKVKCIGLTMWGTIDENTRLELKKASNIKTKILCERQIPDRIEEDNETIESNHTHCILFDSGRLNEYLSDSQRHQFVTEACKTTDNDHTCYAVTIIVEGGLGTLEVLENDIKGERPIVLIQGSGRLADVLATLVEQTSNIDQSQYWDPSKQEIQEALDRFYPHTNDANIPLAINRIEKILSEKCRHLLHVFSLDRDKNVAEIIFKAIFTAKNEKRKMNINNKEKESFEQEKQRRKDEDKLVDLALEWNYFDGVLPILQARQGEIIKKNHDFIKDDIKRQRVLFRKSLEKNRPIFIEYFLSAGFDPLTLSETDDISNYHTIISDLYHQSYIAMNTNHKNRITTLFGSIPLHSIKQLDYELNKFIGPFVGSIYSYKDDYIQNRVKIDLTNHICTCCGTYEDENRIEHQSEFIQNQTKIKYTKHHILRDLFLWSIFMDMSDMAKVLLVHIRSRICASLLASAVFKKYSKLSPTVDMKDKFQIQALEFENYAAKSLDHCYEYNENHACELLLRQIPLFGNITCIQVAISSESNKLLETACFDQTLNQVWFDKLSLDNQRLSAKLILIPSIFTIGLIAPWSISYRKEEFNNTKDETTNSFNNSLSKEGINYYYYNYFNEQSTKWKFYRTQFQYFHNSPMIKMSYHFITYIFFILVFSYMMLYELDGRNTFDIPHWTEIYVIITVCTMFCEEIRKLYLEYDRRMVERWGSTGSTILTVSSNIFYILPYFLFFLGLGFRYGSYNEGLLSTARIIWALDLELWYLRSLKFVMALKFLGPKLFMLKNMLRDLFAFVYMIFIAIAAYGVVSRSLILYKQVPFTGRGIFREVFYEPYWFIYGEVSDKNLLDDLIFNNNTGDRVAEATATHVLLAFHMLFINILLLNLLIAVFADSIDKVQENTEFYWRYQRYSFVREYFERLPLSYPPLIIISHFILLFLYIRRKFCSKLFRNQVADENHLSTLKRFAPIFKMIPIKDSQNEQWDLFENAATYNHARSVLAKNKDKENLIMKHEKQRQTKSTIESNGTQTKSEPQSIENLKEELISTFKTIVIENLKGLEQNNSRLEYRLDQMNTSLEWMMNAIERVKMNNSKEPRPRFHSSTDQLTTNFNQ